MQHSERIGAQRMIIMGEREWSEGFVRVKNLQTRQEDNIKIDTFFETRLE